MNQSEYAKCNIRGWEFKKCALLYAKLREQARWTKSRAVICYPSGQDGAILPARDSRFVPTITFRPSPSRCTKVFFRKIFSVVVKIFSVILCWDGTVTQKSHGNFNLITVISMSSWQLELTTAIWPGQFQFDSWQFQFHHGNSNLTTATSIWPLQLQFDLSNFNLNTATNHVSCARYVGIICNSADCVARQLEPWIKSKLTLPCTWSNWSCRDEIEIVVNQIEIAVVKLKLPWSNWNYCGTSEFWATVGWN